MLELVGSYPNETEYVASLKQSNQIENQLFYLRGGIDFSKLKGFKKKLLQFVGKMMAKDEKTENKEIRELFTKGANFVSEENIEPIIEYIKGEKK